MHTHTHTTRMCVSCIVNTAHTTYASILFWKSKHECDHFQFHSSQLFEWRTKSELCAAKWANWGVCKARRERCCFCDQHFIYKRMGSHVHMCVNELFGIGMCAVPMCVCVCVGFYFWMQMHLIFYCYFAVLSHSLFIAPLLFFCFNFFSSFFTDCFAIFSAIKWPFECHQNRFFLSRNIVDHLFLEYVCELCSLFFYSSIIFLCFIFRFCLTPRIRTHCAFSLRLCVEMPTNAI